MAYFIPGYNLILDCCKKYAVWNNLLPLFKSLHFFLIRGADSDVDADMMPQDHTPHVLYDTALSSRGKF